MALMAASIKEIGVSLKTLDTSPLDDLASKSFKLSTAAVASKITGFVGGGATTEVKNKPMEFTFKPIEINLKLNGVELRKFLVDAEYSKTSET